MTSKQNIKTPKKGTGLDVVLQYLKSKGSPATKNEILKSCNLGGYTTIYNLVSLYPHLVKKIDRNLFKYVESSQEDVSRRNPKPMTLEAKVCEYLKKVGRPVHVRTIKKDCGVNNDSTVSYLPQKHPHLVKKICRGMYEYVGPVEGDQQQQLIKTAPEPIAAKTETSPFTVPVSRVLNNAKLNRPILQRLNDEELIRYHLISNKNVFKKGVDYMGDDLAKINLTYRASLRLATMLGSPETRSQIEEAKSAAEGQDHIRSFDLELLMPDGAPEGFPVSFDALIDALGLHRKKALVRLGGFGPARVQKTPSISLQGRRHHYWLTEHGAKRFVLESGISSARKAPIYDYFIRREQEAQDYRERDRQELTAPSELTAALTGLAQAVTVMMSQQQQTTALLTELVNRQAAQERRLDKSEERARAAEELADEYNHGRTRRIEAATMGYPVTSQGAAKRVGIYTKKGKPHFMAMRSLAESLRLFDHGLAVYDDDSGDHRFVRFNSDGLDVIKAWRQECLDEGITHFEYPRSDSSSWHIYFVRT